MKFTDWERIRGLRKLLATSRPEPVQQARRIVAMQRHIVLPVKGGVILFVLYYLFYSGWFYWAPTIRSVVQETVKEYFLVYVLCNAVASVMLYFWRRFPPELVQWLVFTLGLLDGLFTAGLITITGGFESIVFWVLPGLIVLNAASIPLATPQIVLNLLLSFFYLGAGILYPIIGENQIALLSVPGRSATGQRATNEFPQLTNDSGTDLRTESFSRPREALWGDKPTANAAVEEMPTEPLFLLRASVLWLLTACCYGVQVLAERQRQAEEEAREMGLRQGQLRSAGRLAAEFAHQIKNPLAIINNAVFSLQRALNEGRHDVAGQIKIIQEEVERSDRIVTQIMGYAQLSEGRVEKLNVAEELDRAIERVFPIATDYGVQVERRYASDLPPLLMQRGHLGEILVNLLQNAREASDRRGRVSVMAACPSENLIEISIADQGPGIPPDKLGKIFEAYYTTKEKGTGLGLAIVKHNVELYAGTVRAESALGKGTRFVIVFPAKTALGPVEQS